MSRRITVKHGATCTQGQRETRKEKLKLPEDKDSLSRTSGIQKSWKSFGTNDKFLLNLKILVVYKIVLDTKPQFLMQESLL